MNKIMYIIIMYCIVSLSQPEGRDIVYYGGYLPTVTVTETLNIPPHLYQDYRLLARLVNAEAGGESYLGKWAVADVVIHISKYKGWSIEETIYDSGRFDGIRTKNYFVEPSAESLAVSRKAIMGIHSIPYGVFFFHNPKTSTNSKWVKYISQYKYKDIGNHRFCYHPDFF